MLEALEIKILNGLNSIGGNFVRVEDGDRVLIFDQGIRFDLMSQYYSGFITPKSVAELRELGVLPKPEWYGEGASIYVSHMHLDHMGALSNIPSEARVHLPSLSVYDDIEERWRDSPTWLSLVPRKYYVELEELKPLESDKNSVMAIPVSHSAYPAYSFLYFGKDETVLYTGDFRVDSFLSKDEFHKLNMGENLLDFLAENKDIRVDTLIIEGTNIGSSRLPLTPSEALNVVRRLAENHKQVIATTHALDLEYSYALMKLAAEFDRNFYVATTQTAKILEKVLELPLKPKLIEDYVGYLSSLEKIALEEIEEESFILVSYREVVDFLKDLSSAGKLTDSIAIISEPEPQVEEASEYDIIANWLSRIGIQAYRIRASGHYYPYQLKTILNTIKPRKRIEVIHTEKSSFFHRITDKILSSATKAR